MQLPLNIPVFMTAGCEGPSPRSPPTPVLPSASNSIHELEFNWSELIVLLPCAECSPPPVAGDCRPVGPPLLTTEGSLPRCEPHMHSTVLGAGHAWLLSFSLHMPLPPCSPGSHPHQNFGQSVEELMITMATPTHSPHWMPLIKLMYLFLYF